MKPVHRLTEELAQHKQVEQELKARLRQQAAVAELGQRALMMNDLQALMEEAVALTSRTLDAEYCEILELLPNGQALLLRAGVGWKAGLVGNATVGAGSDSQAGYTLASAEPVVVIDLPRETRFTGPPLLRDHPIISGMTVVIEGKDRPYGVLGAYTGLPRAYTHDDTLFLRGVANILASAIDRHRTEMELRFSRDQLSIILQGVADGITVQDRTGSLVFANEAAAKLIGSLSVQALLEPPVSEVLSRFELLDEAGRPFPPEKLPGRLVLEGAPYASATVGFRSRETGEERWSFIKAQPVFDASGRVDRAVNIFQDITGLNLTARLRNEVAERKKAEEALRSNEAILENLFESAPDAIFLTNRNGEIVRLNTQAEAVFGYRRDELVGKPIDLLLPERFKMRHIDFRSAYQANARTRLMGAGIQLFAKRKNGSEFPVDIMLSPVETQIGPMVISAVRDITERKEIEIELNELQGRLIDGMEADRLYLAQELHDGPIQDLYALTYQIKDLENRLVAGPANLRDVKELAHLVEMIQQVIGLLRSICRDLRPPTLTPFGLEKAIRAHLDEISRTHPELTVEADLAEDGQAIPERARMGLFRIYQHAVSNVLRHAQARHLRVHFDIREEQIVLEVQDDGRGFELPNRWIELARKGHLGLAGTTERAQALGGSSIVHSTPGQGTTVRVTVPRFQDQAGFYARPYVYGEIEG
jgi:PAS domain S-box-containing protein